MTETLQITGVLPPDTRVSLGLVTVRAGDLERIRRLNVPDLGGNEFIGPVAPNPLEDGHEFSVDPGEMGMEAQRQDEEVNCGPTTIQREGKLLTNELDIIAESSKPRVGVSVPVYFKKDGDKSWRVQRP